MPSNIYPISNSARYHELDANSAHGRYYSEWRHLDSFKTLKPIAIVVLMDALAAFTKVTGNEVRLTANAISKKYSVHHRTATNVMLALEERGWIQRVGLAPGPTGQAGGLYELLCISPNGRRVAGPYMSWVDGN